MSAPLEIVFHEVHRSPILEEAIRARAAKLEKFADGITSCRVTVERPNRHHQQGNLYNVRIAGAEVVTSRNHGNGHSHENVLVALTDAFAAARRQLQDYSRARREVR
jgi:Sigma 54 modulation protein / S30EA ribosomal protein